MHVTTPNAKVSSTALWLAPALLCLLLPSSCKDDPPPPPKTRRALPAAAASVALDQVHSAVAAAAQKAPAGTGPCVRAWLELSELARNNPTAAPPQPDFVTKCRTLPPPAQACLALSYALDNPGRCNEALAALPPAQRRLASDLLSPTGAPP